MITPETLQCVCFSHVPEKRSFVAFDESYTEQVEPSRKSAAGATQRIKENRIAVRTQCILVEWSEGVAAVLTDCFLCLLSCHLQTACRCLDGFQGSGRYCVPFNPCRNVCIRFILLLVAKQSVLICFTQNMMTLFKK